MRTRTTFFVVSFLLLSFVASAVNLVPDQSPLQMSAAVGKQQFATVTITSSGAPLSGLSITVSTASGGNWLLASAAGQTTTPLIIYAYATAGALQAGTYNGSIKVTASGAANSPLTIPVQFTVGGSSPPPPTTGSLTLDSSSLTFSAQAGASSPASKQVSVSSNPSGASFTASASTSSGGNWLQVSPKTGSTPSTLTVTVNTAGMSSGTYFGTVALVPSSGVEVDVNVTLNLTSGSALTVDSGGLQFVYQFGSIPPTSQTFNVTGGTPPLTFTATTTVAEGTGWLSVDPKTGTTPQTETVSVAPLNLAAGVYHGKVTVAATSAANGSVDVPVTLTVTAGALLTVGTLQPFTFQTGGATPTAQTVAVGSVGTPLAFTVTSSTSDKGNWLAVSPASGTTPQNLTIAVDPTSLPAGSYSGTVTVAAPSAGNSPINIPVSLTVSSNTTLVASTSSVVLNYQIGGLDEVLSQPIVVTSNGGPVSGTAAATASSTASSCPPGWLQAFPNSFTTPGTVYVTLNPTGLSQTQSCIGSLVLSGGGDPIQIPVTANIASTPFFNIRPLSITFTAPYLSQQQVVQTIELSTTDRQPKNYKAAAATSTGGSWISVGPPSGSTPGSLTVTADPYQMPVGSYAGVVKVTSEALPQGQLIPVTLNIMSTSTATVNPAALSFAQTLGGAAPAAQVVNVTATGGSQPFTATAVQGNLPGTLLNVTALSATAPGQVSVSLAANSLPAGNYTASVSILVPAASATPISIPVKIAVTNGPAPSTGIAVTPATLAFTYQQGGDLPAAKQVNATFGGGSVNVGSSIAPDATRAWLKVTPDSGATPASFTVTADPAALAPGTYTSKVTLTPPSTAGAPVDVPVTLTVTAPAVTQAKISTLTNAASGVQGTVSPGEIIAVNGSGLGPAIGVGLVFTPEGLLSTTLSGTRAFFDEYAAPLLYVSAGQVNAIVPYEVAGRNTVQVVVEKQGIRSQSYTVQISPAAPGIFTATQNGRGQGAILNEDSNYNGPAIPAARGSIVQIFGTGEGVTQPPGATGSVTLTRRAITGRVTATVGGLPAEVMFAGAAPQAIAGLFQVNVRIPQDALTGDVPIVLNIGGTNSQTGVTVAVQ